MSFPGAAARGDLDLSTAAPAAALGLPALLTEAALGPAGRWPEPNPSPNADAARAALKAHLHPQDLRVVVVTPDPAMFLPLSVEGLSPGAVHPTDAAAATPPRYDEPGTTWIPLSVEELTR